MPNSIEKSDRVINWGVKLRVALVIFAEISTTFIVVQVKTWYISIWLYNRSNHMPSDCYHLESEISVKVSLSPNWWIAPSNRQRSGADVLAPMFGADAMMLRVLGTKKFWLRRFCAKTFWRLSYSDGIKANILQTRCSHVSSRSCKSHRNRDTHHW